MPHPDANRHDAETLDEAFDHLRAAREGRRLWTVMKFDTGGRYHVFHSTSSFTQQMFGLSKTIFEMSGHYGRGQPHGRSLAALLTNKLALSQAGRPHAWGGHAEEHMIQWFDDCRRSADGARSVILWNSDSPCRPADRQPSDNMANWPSSCHAKLNRLATLNPTLTFIVYVRKLYGALAGGTMDQGIDTLRAENIVGNLRFVKFTEDLVAQSRGL